MNPFTHFRPSLGFYDAGQPERRRASDPRDAVRPHHRRDVLVVGPGEPDRPPLRHAPRSPQRLGFKWAIYHELEGYGDPTVEEIRADLEYIRDRYAASPGYLKLGGRPVVFVYGDADDGVGCDAARAGRRRTRPSARTSSCAPSAATAAASPPSTVASVLREQVRVRPLPVRVRDLARGSSSRRTSRPKRRSIRSRGRAASTAWRLAGAVPVRDQLQRVGRGDGDRERRAVGEPLGLRPLPRRPARGSRLAKTSAPLRAAPRAAAARLLTK